MAKRRSGRVRSAKQKKYNDCMSVQISKQRRKLLKSPTDGKLPPAKLQQKAFKNAAKICKP
jgi:hypothetical protein